MTERGSTTNGKERQTIGARLRGLMSTPDEGWSALAAVLVMFLVVGVAVDDAQWVGQIAGTKTSQTMFLPLEMVLAVLLGFMLGRSRMPTARAHIIAAVSGAAFLLVAVSASVSSLPSLELRLNALSESLATYVGDVAIRGIKSAETSIFLLLVGALLWTAGYLGAFGLFRRHRAGPAITLAATAVLINMSITIHDQLAFLVVMISAALLLVVRSSLAGQMEQWRSRRIADSGYASQLFVRSGVTFVVTAIALSLVLAVNASSAPLRPMWDRAVERMVEVGIEINHFLGGVSGEARGPNLLFTPSQIIRDRWESSTDPLFSVITDDGRAYRWRGATYQYFDGQGWQQLPNADHAVPAFTDLQAAGELQDGGLTAGRHNVVTEVSAIEDMGHVIVAPGDPYQLSLPGSVQTNAVNALQTVRLNDQLVQGSSYVVFSRVFDQVGSGSLTAADLAGATRQYGEALLPYVEIPDSAIGPSTRRIADERVAELPANQRDPYHIAKAMQDWLFDTGGFEYDIDVTGMCVGENKMDCFLREKHGYCEYFATALAMMLRTQQIPARYVTGFLPGERHDFVEFDEDGQPQNVREQIIRRSAAHAWVEVYFPGFGWYPFDPTPGLGEAGQETTDLVEGSPRPTPSGSPAAAQTPNFGRTPGAGVDVPPPSSSNPGNAAGGVPTSLALGVFAAVLGLAALLIVFARRRKLPVGGQMTYDSVARIATRFGYAPLPSQTAYEYANRLAVVVPAVTDELRVVATAKVESVYGKREPSEELKVRLMIAYRRVRMSLLRMFMRRPSLNGTRWRR